jgi:mannan endo-1,4-beta-mannosidase
MTKKLSRKSLAVAIFAALTIVAAGYLILSSRAATTKPADLNNDGQINIFDLSILLSKWKQTGAQASDLNNDNAVDIYDLSIILSKWGAAAPPSTQFLTRNGKDLMYQGQVYRTAGVNAYGLATCEGNTYSAAELDSLFQAARPKSLTRSWATSRATIAELDRLISRAEANNQMLILGLADGANHCNKDTAKLDRAWYQSGYKTAYFDWLKTIIPRYANSPAIGMWEIANEPGWGCNCGITREEYRSFFDTTADLIKSLDPNHLVESGTLGINPAEIKSGTDYQYIHAGPNVDVLSIHEYEYDYNGNMNALGNFSTYKTAANNLNKPIIVGETGAKLNQPTNATCRNSSVTIDQVAKAKFDDYFAKGANVVLIWDWMKVKPSWVTNGCTSNQHFFYGPSNSVLQLIRNYSL